MFKLHDIIVKKVACIQVFRVIYVFDFNKTIMCKDYSDGSIFYLDFDKQKNYKKLPYKSFLKDVWRRFDNNIAINTIQNQTNIFEAIRTAECSNSIEELNLKKNTYKFLNNLTKLHNLKFDSLVSLKSKTNSCLKKINPYLKRHKIKDVFELEKHIFNLLQLKLT